MSFGNSKFLDLGKEICIIPKPIQFGVASKILKAQVLEEGIPISKLGYNN